MKGHTHKRFYVPIGEIMLTLNNTCNKCIEMNILPTNILWKPFSPCFFLNIILFTYTILVLYCYSIKVMNGL